MDVGSNGQFTLSIEGDSGINQQFKIDGLDLLTGSRNVGYESQAENDYKIILEVIAVDKPESGFAKTTTAVVILEILPVNEKSPVWKSPTVDSNGRFPDVRIPEDISPGSNISTFEATDDDMGTDGIVTYHLISVTTNAGSVVEDIFLLDMESGVLRTRANLDRDDATGGVEYYDVVLEARDSNESPRTSRGTVWILLDNVNDNLPVIDCLYVLHVQENTSIGETILTLPDSDADQDSVTFTILDTDKVDIQSGTNNVNIAQAFDFETETSYTALISASDGKHVVNSTLIIMVVDVNDEAPEVTISSISIREELKPGTAACGAFTATDRDEGDVLTFNISGKLVIAYMIHYEVYTPKRIGSPLRDP
ncbi:protocadherin gamma-A4-like [Gigantopelta aegis]|uniref:protocadherin gamma-A4-like n=1 Tax=Gigantopelta aegis TaxID=1735272 RepID=UPI001B88E5F4|nr:protocadherin gamma-A4-like [Gigantopelta aegis]